MMKNSDIPQPSPINWNTDRRQASAPFNKDNQTKPLWKDTDIGHFAGLAMQGAMAESGSLLAPEVVAEWAVQNAQALLDELEKQK